MKTYWYHTFSVLDTSPKTQVYAKYEQALRFYFYRSYFPPALLLKANEFTLTGDAHRKMTGFNEKVLCIVHSVIQKLEQVYSLHGKGY